MSATPEQVDAALRLRESDVTALGVFHDGTYRLLILRDANAEPKSHSREAALYERWEGVLKRLAQ